MNRDATGPGGNPHQRYEYQFVERPNLTGAEEAANNAGSDGWRVVALVCDQTMNKFVVALERPRA